MNAARLAELEKEARDLPEGVAVRIDSKELLELLEERSVIPTLIQDARLATGAVELIVSLACAWAFDFARGEHQRGEWEEPIGVVLCGVPPPVPHPTEFSADGETCPKCGAKEVLQGFGLAGGGYGPYEMCDADGCDWFAKRQENE